MGKNIFEAIGRSLGQTAAQARNAFQLVGGTEEESLRAEIRLGRAMAAAVLERTPLVAEDRNTTFAVEVGHWLASHVREKKIPFGFYVTAEGEPGALALPGGSIFVSWPLLELCQWQRDEVAFVLGHEMAHIVRRHTLDRIVKDAALSLLLRHSSVQQAASAWLGQSGRQVLSRAFSHDDELEADAFAVALIRSAGGDPLAGEHLLEKLARLFSSQGLSAYYFTSHPSLAERLANLRASGQSPVTSRQ